MMESTRLKPDYLSGSLEYDTEFYSGQAEAKFTGANVGVGVDVDTSDEFFIDDIICFDEHQEPPAAIQKTPPPIYRPNPTTTTRPLYIVTRPMVVAHPTVAVSHPILPASRPSTLTRVSSLDERAFESHTSQHQQQHRHYSRLREALTSSGHPQPGTIPGRLSDPVQPRLPILPVQCSRCGGELNSKCLVQACDKPDQTTCKVCGQEMTIKCILAVCGQEFESQAE